MTVPKLPVKKEVRKGIEEGLNAIIVNPTGVFGPYDYQPSHFGTALLSMANGKMPALIDGGFDWVDARDVAQGAMLAEKKAPAGSKYLLSGHWVSMPDIADMIKEISDAINHRFRMPDAGGLVLALLLQLPITVSWQTGFYTSVSLRALKSNHHISHEKATRELGLPAASIQRNFDGYAEMVCAKR